MKDELNYKINIEPVLFSILNHIEDDVAGFGISEEDFLRAVWVYADMKLNQLETPPQWLWTEINRKQQQAEASNTVEGEVGG